MGTDMAEMAGKNTESTVEIGIESSRERVWSLE